MWFLKDGVQTVVADIYQDHIQISNKKKQRILSLKFYLSLLANKIQFLLTIIIIESYLTRFRRQTQAILVTMVIIGLSGVTGQGR